MAFVHGDFKSASSILTAAATRPQKTHEDETRERGEVPEIASVYTRMRRFRMAQIARVEADVLKHLALDLRSRGKTQSAGLSAACSKRLVSGFRNSDTPDPSPVQNCFLLSI